MSDNIGSSDIERKDRGIDIHEILNTCKRIFKELKGFYNNNKKVVRIGLILLISTLVIIDVVYAEETKPKEVTYAEFKKDLNAGKIDTIYYNATDDMMRYTLYTKKTRKMTKKEREEYHYPKEQWRLTSYPAQENFRKEMLEKGVSLQVRSFDPISIVIISTLAPIAFLVFLFVITCRAINGSITGGNISDESLVQKSDVKFSDIIGHEEVIKDLKFIVDLLKDKEKYNKLGASVPRGILLSGEPGTGKTLLAKAIAGESDVPFIYMNASSFIELYVGTGAKRVRQLFKIAKKHQPCIIFIDEIDAVGKARGSSHSTSENDQTINALLQEMDGFDDRGNIFVIAATNNPECLDKALIRAGRFDRQVVIRPPKDWKVRKDLFEFYLKDCSLADNVNITAIAKQLVGFTGADINSIVNEAKIIATMQNSDIITMDNLEEAVDKIIFKGNRSKSEEYNHDKQVVAYHEAGHAVVTYLLGQPIARATIIASTSGVGGAVFGEEANTKLVTKDYYEDKVKICYGGRVSEAIKFGQITTGASNDIEQATSILSEYVTKLGFNEEFGVLNLDILLDKHLIDSSNSFEVIQSKAKELYEDTFKLLSENYNLVETLAQVLLERETIGGDAIVELLDEQRVKSE